MIDGTMEGDPAEYKPRTEEEMAKYLQIVQSAVGFDEDRGDVIKVENIQFNHSQMDEEKDALETAEQIDLAIEIGKLVVGLVFLILFFTRIIRPVITWMTTAVEIVEAPDDEEIAEIEEQKAEEKRLKELSKPENMRNAVAEFVLQDPKYTAGVIRKWMREKAPTTE